MFESALDQRLMVLRIAAATTLLSLGFFVTLAQSGLLPPPSGPASAELETILAAAGAALAIASLALPPHLRKRVGSAHVGALTASTLVAMALSEAVGILGLVATVLGASAGLASGLFVAGFALLALHWPRRARLERDLAAMTRL